MLRETALSRSIRLMFTGGLAMGLLVQPAMADDTQRVEITGSSIKRIAQEGALPVQLISQEDIKCSGAQSITDLIQQLPAMQGFTVSADSVNGGGGGLTTASLRSLGADYTLVLLNGKRIAPATSGSTVNLQNIPLSAIERVEVLTDGASAIYGADAIAGVVNFVLKKNSTEGGIEATYTSPHESGGASSRLSLSKGFGNLDTDGFNILFAYSHDEQKELNAIQRDFSGSGKRLFDEGGKKYAMLIDSSNSIPANATPRDSANNALTVPFNPAYMKDGKCPERTFQDGYTCRFDYASTVQLVPEGQRDGLFVSGRLKVNDNFTLFSDLLWSKASMLPRYAPPAQPVVLRSSNSAQRALLDQYVRPYIAQLGGNPASLDNARLGVRVLDAGGRKDEYEYDAKHIVLGGEGAFMGWDLNASYTHSENDYSDTAKGGYLSFNRLTELIDKGAYNPFLPPGGSVEALKPAVLNETLTTATSKLDTVNLRGSRPVYDLKGGSIMLGLGLDYMKQSYATWYSAISMGQNQMQPNYTDSVVGGTGGFLPTDATRDVAAAFAEVLVPLTKELEITGALRRDQYSAVTNDKTYDSDGNPIGTSKQGKAYGSNTYKLGLRYQPMPALLLRGSYGTGFRAPTLADVTDPIAAAGVTSRSYNCPFPSTDPLARGCFSARAEYNLESGGNPSTGDSALRPEKSKQWAFGLRAEPAAWLSVGLDLWSVRMRDQISTIPFFVAFDNPQVYRGLFSVKPDPQTREPTLTLLQAPVNLAKSSYKGLDIDLISRVNTGIGKLTLRGAGTYMIEAEYSLPDDNGNPVMHSSLGKYGKDRSVVFRWQMKLGATLDTGAFSNTLTANYKSGYQDSPLVNGQGPAIRVVNADGSIGGSAVNLIRRVPSYTTFDWQTKWTGLKNFTLTGGIKNLFNAEPPFSVQDSGTGDMRGFDPRYSDVFGRTFYLTGAYKF